MKQFRKFPPYVLIYLLIGVGIVCSGVVAFVFMHRAPAENVMTQYNAADNAGKQLIAENFLKEHSASELLAQLEVQHVDTVCHTEAHPIGRAVYEKYPNFTDAIKQCGNACSYGCFHGVLMEMFKTDSDTLGGVIEDETPAEYLGHVRDLARGLCTSPEVESVVKHHYCFHGIGHVFQFVSGDNLDEAIESCKVFSDHYRNDACVSGAFMEHFFNSSTTVSAATIAAGRSRAPCDAYPAYTGACFTYKAYIWIKAWGGLAQALNACQSFGTEINRCVRSVAEAASSPTAVETEAGFDNICSTVPNAQRDSCVQGMLTKIIETNNGDTSDHVCDHVAPTYIARCLYMVHTYPYLKI